MKIETSEVEQEFEGLEFGDPRLARRGRLVATRVVQNPGLSFPKIFENDIELEGFYRFVRNESVTGEKLLAPHIKNTVRRIGESGGPVLCVHDTTKFTFEGRRNLGLVEGNRRGFLAHCSLAFGIDGTPLGALGLHTWQREEDKPTPTKLRKLGLSQQAVLAMPSEMDRWGEAILAAEKVLEKPQTLIHVADSESDDYRLLLLLNKNECRYVVRGCYDRRIVDSKQTHLGARLLVQSPVAYRSVTVEPRVQGDNRNSKRNPPRPGRLADLKVRAARVSLEKPAKLSAQVDASLEVNVVHVVEENPPPGQIAIEWTLLTSEPIETVESILATVDIYRRRWLIEEFFKALKTGCAFEARQLETFETFDSALSIFVPVAWGLMRLRALERTNSEMSAQLCFTSDQLAVLRAKSRKPVTTVAHALAAIAQLGGHIRNNGQPGWLVLWRGYRDLLLLAQGFALGRTRNASSNDQS
jgi:Transposase DNA-binding/Transposase DDE domain